MRDKVTLEIEPIQNGFLVTLNQEEIASINGNVGLVTVVTKTACRSFPEVLKKVFDHVGSGGKWQDFVKNHLNPNEENPE